MSLYLFDGPIKLQGSTFRYDMLKILKCIRVKSVKFLLVSHSDVDNHVSELKLEERYESWSTVPVQEATTCMFLTVYSLLRSEEPLLIL